MFFLSFGGIISQRWVVRSNLPINNYTFPPSPWVGHTCRFRYGNMGTCIYAIWRIHFAWNPSFQTVNLVYGYIFHSNWTGTTNRTSASIVFTCLFLERYLPSVFPIKSKISDFFRSGDIQPRQRLFLDVYTARPFLMMETIVNRSPRLWMLESFLRVTAGAAVIIVSRMITRLR